MSEAQMGFTVFTKPWREMPLADLADFIREFGFDGIELPVRPGYQVPPEDVPKGLPEAAKVFSDHGVKIGSIAGPTDETAIAACAEAGVPIIRVCVEITQEKDYLSAIADIQRGWDEIVPILDKHKVMLGVQNHCSRCIANAMQLRHALEPYDPKNICAVWDAAHNALEGEQVDIALDTVWSDLGLVNLKNGYWRRTSGPEAVVAQWRVYWTTGRQGRADWGWVIRELKKRGYRGDLCLSAEYSDHDRVNELIADDIAFARGLVAEASSK